MQKLATLFLITFIPLFLSTLLYVYRDHFHFSTKNYGAFIQPPISFSADAQKKWQIVYFPASQNASSDAISHTLSQLQKALGKKSLRVRVVVLKDPNPLLQKNHIYLVDPLGNAFMRYPETENPMHILKDLKHVLEVSQIG